MNRTYPSNIIAHFNQATPAEYAAGVRWYPDAHAYAADLAQQHGQTIATVCGIIAALSPSNKWPRNKADAAAILQQGPAASVATYNTNKAKALAIAHGAAPLDILRGRKVRAFYQNILNPACNQTITIDRHAARIAYRLKATLQTADIAKKALQRVGTYDRLTVCYQKALTQLSHHELSLCQLQAVTWLVYKRIQGV